MNVNVQKEKKLCCLTSVFSNKFYLEYNSNVCFSWHTSRGLNIRGMQKILICHLQFKRVLMVCLYLMTWEVKANASKK